jgi:hypothetical protein
MSEAFLRALGGSAGEDGGVDAHNCSCALDQQAGNDHEDHGEHHHAELVMLFPFVVLAVGAGSEMLVHKTSIPYTTFLLLIGAVIGYLMRVSCLGLTCSDSMGRACRRCRE